MADVRQYRTLASATSARVAAATGVTVPVQLILATIQAESSGNPRATRREPDGRISRGLMQVLEGTARELGLRDPQQLYVPAIAIEVGTYYLAQQLKRYGGRVAHAIAAYNAGSVRFTPQEKYVNQRYVDKVLGIMRALERQAGGTPSWVLLAIAGTLVVSASRRARRAHAA